MLDLLRKLFGKSPAPPRDVPAEAADEVRSDLSVDIEWMFPPRTVVEAVPWNQYWYDQLTHNVAGFVHMFVDDGELVDFMRANELKTVLCVGNGISLEPRALAWAGFEVTALDISPLAAEIAREAMPNDEVLARLVGGRVGGEGGSVQYIVGDVADPTSCPGPFDVVIDRKTLQMWPEADRSAVLHAVANRLASRAVFFSHCHDGGWRPPAPPRHATAPWFTAEGWENCQRDAPLKGRVAWLYRTTG